MKATTAMMISGIIAASGIAFADFEATHIGLTGVTDGVHINNGGFVNQDFDAGHLEFEYTNGVGDGGERGGGQFSGGSFSSFCIELQQISSGPRSYAVDSIRNGPNPASGAGVPAYDAADEAEVNAVVAAAIRLGWINNDLSAASASNTQLAAVQGQIWKMVLDNSVVTGNGAVAIEMAVLQAEIANDPFAVVRNLNAMLNADTQDQLFIVPLPTAAFAGLFTMVGLGGLSRIRRR
jgi:hypothetical protein